MEIDVSSARPAALRFCYQDTPRRLHGPHRPFRTPAEKRMPVSINASCGRKQLEGGHLRVRGQRRRSGKRSAEEGSFSLLGWREGPQDPPKCCSSIWGSVV